nr:unnamed protein product [Spirometra erinaceieuropaei]
MKFTMEEEEEGEEEEEEDEEKEEEKESNQLAFLDVFICLKDYCGLKTKVFRKTTNTMQVLNFNNCPLKQKYSPWINRPERRTTIVARELARYKVVIARSSEQVQLEDVGAGYTFFWSRRPRTDRRDAGVAFSISNDIVERLS